MKFQIATIVAAALFVLAALLAGPYRLPAAVGASIAGVTAVGSIFAMGRAARARGNPTQSALAVMAVTFLVRLVLVGVGTVLVARAAGDVTTAAFAFVVAFFVPFFAFTALEGLFLHSLRRMGTPA